MEPSNKLDKRKVQYDKKDKNMSNKSLCSLFASAVLTAVRKLTQNLKTFYIFFFYPIVVRHLAT